MTLLIKLNSYFITMFNISFQLQHLFKKVVERVFRDEQDYRSTCAMFICNKWDQVSNTYMFKLKYGHSLYIHVHAVDRDYI